MSAPELEPATTAASDADEVSSLSSEQASGCSSSEFTTIGSEPTASCSSEPAGEPPAAAAAAASSSGGSAHLRPLGKRCIADRLRARELDACAPAKWKRHCARERFSHFSLAASHDTHDPDGANLRLSFLRRRSKIVEIVSSGDIVFALTLSGVCAAFRGKTRLAFLNTTPDEVIRSLFYNKASQALITVSVYREDNFSSLKCRNTHIEYIRRGRPDLGFAIFSSECLKWPGFVEFDDVNCKILTYNASDTTYRVWSMANYEKLYSLPGADVSEIKISPGIMLLIHARQGSYIPLQILSIEDGSVLKSFSHLLQRDRNVDFIEQFNEKLLVKEEGENLSIVDVHTSEVVTVSKTEFITPSAFIFLYENNLFLTFRQRQVTVWNFRGEQVTQFDDHTLWHPDTNTNNIFITSSQDYIVSFCRPSDADSISSSSSSSGDGRLDRRLPHTEGNVASSSSRGTVNISHILTGKCVAKLVGNDDGEGLGDVTALHFSEERNEIYVGNRQGVLHVWSQ